jgi:hypothetical protein
LSPIYSELKKFLKNLRVLCVGKRSNQYGAGLNNAEK